MSINQWLRSSYTKGTSLLWSVQLNNQIWTCTSDKSCAPLAKQVQSELLPVQDEDDEELSDAISKALPLNVIEATIKEIASRNNYGLESIPGGGKVPAGLHIWRWEVKDSYRSWLPKSAKEKIDIRMAERQQVSIAANHSQRG